jgi:hypothetical protein
MANRTVLKGTGFSPHVVPIEINAALAPEGWFLALSAVWLRERKPPSRIAPTPRLPAYTLKLQ